MPKTPPIYYDTALECLLGKDRLPDVDVLGVVIAYDDTSVYYYAADNALYPLIDIKRAAHELISTRKHLPYLFDRQDDNHALVFVDDLVLYLVQSDDHVSVYFTRLVAENASPHTVELDIMDVLDLQNRFSLN